MPGPCVNCGYLNLVRVFRQELDTHEANLLFGIIGDAVVPEGLFKAVGLRINEVIMDIVLFMAVEHLVDVVVQIEFCAGITNILNFSKQVLERQID